MIEKLVSESEWTDVLAKLPAMSMPRGPVIFVAPHPDDECLSAGGLIAALVEAGAFVTVAAVTDGEAAYIPEGDTTLAAIRRKEQTSALSLLGVPEGQVVRFGVPDRLASENERALVERLIDLLKEAGSDATIIAPWSSDFHSDHEATGRAAEIAAARTGCRLVRWFWWSWHRRTVAELTALPLQQFALEPRWLDLKLAALAEHRSQIGPGAILPDDLLAPAHRNIEVFA